MIELRILVGFVVVLGGGRGALAQHHFSAYGAARGGVIDARIDPGPADLSSPAWIFPASDPAVPGVTFVPEASVLVEGALVYAVSRSPSRLWAIDRETGVAVWWVAIAAPVLDSWSAPAIDRVNRTIIVASGSGGSAGGEVRAFDLETGVLRWQTTLSRDIVNASPVVSTDLGPRDRAFIVDYEGFYTGGSGASLHAINVDAFDTARNPHQPGEIVWSLPLFTGASGASAAYSRGRVYFATAGDFGGALAGEILCVDAQATDASEAVLWRTEPAGDDGFLGGVAVARGAVYAQSYDFFGGPNSSRLVKLDAFTGAVHWQVPAARTSSTPLVLPDGRVVVSGGIAGFGSVPTVQLFRDDGTSATLVGDTALDTWQDDGDGLLEPGEFEILGGWSHQPLAVIDPTGGGGRLFVGEPVLAGGLFAGYGRLRAVDLSVAFAEPGWVEDVYDGAGASPAIVGRTLYTVGPSGLAAFGLPDRPDVNRDGVVDVEDLIAWTRGEGARDVDRDGTVTDADRRMLEGFLRRYEREDRRGGRR